MKNKVLLISYLFPPVGGAGVQRNLKYVKYLPEFGWQPYVLTVKDINYYVYDKSLLSEVPKGTMILRTGSFDPLRVSNLLLGVSKGVQPAEGAVRNRKFAEDSPVVRTYRKVRDMLAFPDTQLGWIPFAVDRGLRAIRRHRIQVIVGSIGPVSNAIVAYLLARKTGLPYLLDFRDGWLDDPYSIRPTALHQAGQAALEKQVVANADFVTVYDDYLAQKLVARYPQLNGRTAALPNGFDPDDLNGISAAAKDNNKHRIVYAGSLYGRLEPNFKVLLAALNKLPVEVLKSLEVLFVGQTYDGIAEQVREAGLSDCVKFAGYVSHAESLSFLSSAAATLLFLPAGDVAAVTGKVFEYLMVQKPIIACVEPTGVCAAILRRAGQDQWISAPSDVEKLKQTVLSLSECSWPLAPAGDVEQFSRRHNTKKLAEILESLTLEKLASAT